MKESELIIGKTYFCKDYNEMLGNSFIFLYERDIRSCKFLDVKENSNCYSYGGGDFTRQLHIREATLEETHWLQVCIKENQFVSYSKAMQSFKNESYDFPKELTKLLKELNII